MLFLSCDFRTLLWQTVRTPYAHFRDRYEYLIWWSPPLGNAYGVCACGLRIADATVNRVGFGGGKQKQRTEKNDDRSVRMKKLLSYYKVLFITVMAMGMVATFSNSIASADHPRDGVFCDSGVGVNQHCYELVEVAMDWYAAEAYARASSHDGVYGHLATITSGAETGFIVASFPSLFAPGVVPEAEFAWFGGFRSGEVGAWGNWEWVTPEPWSYDNWSTLTGEPTQGPNGSDGLQAVTEFFHNGPSTNWSNTGTWNDQSPTAATRYFVGEYDEHVPVTRTTLLGG